MRDDTAPQIGPYDVERSALALDGERLQALLTRIGAPTETLPPATPDDGWRVLAEAPTGEGSLLLGHPADPARSLWHLAHVSGTEPARVTVQPDPQPLRRSVAERRAGLAIRWPAITRELLDVDALAVDIVNEGAERWFPDDDSFYATASLVPAGGSSGGGFFFAWASGQDRPLPLDPGDYLRVHARIDSSQWRDAQPGPYLIHAFTPTLRLTTAEPLRIELTPELIAAHRPSPHRAPPPAGHERQATEDRLRILHAYRAARDRFPELVDAIRDARDDQAALARIAELLHITDDAAQAVYNLQLRRLRIGPQDLLAIETEALEQRLRDLA
ncbi:hypothetical protein [Leifsonia virtsii]|uniref:Uncharacterized protein n=1 Tax=Leifsonia virtsii TaxID=3035915 RepID=A0ABT8J142_9MICO|nr:hypothetical protein [Leifsonia virtsii]MDN4598603.1 hypothetical protein [Leifsonia virtsii]